MRDEPSRTAEVVCAMRASDQRRPGEQRILDDPYAKLFLGPVLRAALATLEATGRIGDMAEPLAVGLTTYILTRHRFIDDAILRALDAGAAQLVLLGAGYDTRAYRFTSKLGGRPVYEVDFPATSERKARIVREHHDELPTEANVRVVEIDFRTESLEERLLAAGFERSERTFFVWEGVSMYLPRSTVKDTLRTVRALGADGSELAMDFWYLLDSPDLFTTAHRMSANLLHFLGEPIVFGIHPEDVGPFLERLGWSPADIAEAPELERRYVQDDRKVYPANYVVHARSV